MADELTPPPAAPAAPAAPATPPPAAPAPPAAPSLPATVTLPGEPPAAPATISAEEQRGKDFDDIWARPAAPAPAAPAAPATPPPAPAAPKPPEPEAPKPPEPKPPVAPPAPEAPKPPEAAKPDDEALPEDLLEGITEANPTNARDAVKRTNKLYARLRKAGQLIKDLKSKGPAGEGKVVPPPDYEAVKQRVGQLETEVKSKETELGEVRERLFAQDMTQRPEYQEKVVKPWKAVKETLTAICKRYGQNYEDVKNAFGLPPDERDKVFVEMMGLMNPLDQRRFTDAVEATPRIRAEQDRLESYSKAKGDEFRTAEKQRVEKVRGDTLAKAVASSNAHYQKTRAEMPFLYEIPGDTPAIKQYNEGMAEAIKIGEQLTRAGVDTLSPEIQGMLVHDAVTADYMRRYLASVLQGHIEKGKQMAAKLEELETANKQLQSSLDEYRGADAARGGTGHVPGAPGSGTPGSVPTLEQNTSLYATSLGWKT